MTLPSSPAISAITLDLDDTLWPILPTLLRAEVIMERWLAEAAPVTASSYSRERLQALRLSLFEAFPERRHDLGWLRQEALRRALSGSGEDPALADQAFAVFARERSRVELYPDVEPILRRWAQRWPLAVITNGNADVGAIGLAPFFRARLAAHEVGFGKPDVRIFHSACAQLGVAPDRVLHIGDDLALDIAGARAAGLQAAWVQRPDLAGSAGSGHAGPPPARSDTEAGADEPVFRSLADIDRWLG